MKPRNFPERKRARQVHALAHLGTHTKAGVSNEHEIETLLERVQYNRRAEHSKKDRSANVRFRTIG